MYSASLKKIERLKISLKKRHFFLIPTILFFVSCSSLRNVEYNSSLYGGSPDHAPFKSKNLFTTSRELFFQYQINPVAVIPKGENFLVFSDQGTVFLVDIGKGDLSVFRETGLLFRSVIGIKDGFIAVLQGSELLKLDEDIILIWKIGFSEKIVSHPVCDGDFLFLATEYSLHRISAEDGSLQNTAGGLDLRGCGETAPFLLKNGIIIPSAPGEVSLFGREDLYLKWTYNTGNFFPFRAVPVMTKSGPAVLDCSGSLNVLDPEDGTLREKFNLVPFREPVFASFDGKDLFVSSLSSERFSFSYSLEKNVLNWHKEGYSGVPGVFKDAVLLAGDSSLCVFDRAGNPVACFREESGLKAFFVFSNAFFMFSEKYLRIIIE
ncbi:hypothetical protein JW890_03080 [candidate division WOR-3 bacterium]|nr:hypothetical protein [candidate division WOR-3 bacterium]